jgi:hypothetical protein
MEELSFAVLLFIGFLGMGLRLIRRSQEGNDTERPRAGAAGSATYEDPLDR